MSPFARNVVLGTYGSKIDADASFHFSRPNNDDIAAFMKIPPDNVSPHSSVFINSNPSFRRTFLVDNSSNSSTSSDSSKAPSVTSIRGLQLPEVHLTLPPRRRWPRVLPPKLPLHLVSMVRRPYLQRHSPSHRSPRGRFKIDTTKMAKNRKKAQAKTGEEGIVGSGAEEAERSAALFTREGRARQARCEFR